MSSLHTTDILDLALRTTLLVLGFALIMLALLARWHASHPKPLSPRRLFQRLARVSGLSPLDRLLLASVARRQKVNAAALLLSPHTMRHHVRPYLAARAALLRPALARRLERLAQHL